MYVFKVQANLVPNYLLCQKSVMIMTTMGSYHIILYIYLFQKSIFGDTASRYRKSEVLPYISRQYYNT
jgi:hypothetical protein